MNKKKPTGRMPSLHHTWEVGVRVGRPPPGFFASKGASLAKSEQGPRAQLPVSWLSREAVQDGRREAPLGALGLLSLDESQGWRRDQLRGKMWG